MSGVSRGPTARWTVPPPMAGDEWCRLERVARVLLELPAPPGATEVFPRWRKLRSRLAVAAEGADPEAFEEALLELYAHLHLNDAPYTPTERQRLDDAGGYWNHAGGLSPVLRAGPWLGPDSTSLDLGAGNGLQGLLLQRLYPHRLTIQVEISSALIELGRQLQLWLGIPQERVRWIVGDVRDAGVDGVDFLYLYRPLKPGRPEGDAFYRRLARDLEASDRRVVVFSVADCLRQELDGRWFDLLGSDGHLTRLRRRTRPEGVRPGRA